MRRPLPRQGFCPSTCISAGCRTTGGGCYSFEATTNKNCIIGNQNKTPLHRCLIPVKLAPDVEDIGVLS